jgi:hypothetical protein
MQLVFKLLTLLAAFPSFGAAPAMNISVSRQPLQQGIPFAIFVSDPDTSSHSAISLNATVDGASVSLTPLSSGLWVYSSQAYGTSSEHTFALSIFELGILVGTQGQNFFVDPNTTVGTFPTVTSVTPNLGPVMGNTQVLIQGSNFTNAASVKINGTPVLSTFVDSGDLLAFTPNFQTTTGQVPVEVDMPALNTLDARAVVLPNAFYAGLNVVGGDVLPVAVLSNASQNVNVGSNVALDGAESNDPRGLTLSYEWSFLVVPGNSTIVAGSDLVNSAHPSFVPDVAGTYVVRFAVRETGSNPLSSDPQLAVVQAGTAAGFAHFSGLTRVLETFARSL